MRRVLPLVLLLALSAGLEPVRAATTTVAQEAAWIVSLQIKTGDDKGLIPANAGNSYCVPYFSNIAASGLAAATVATGDVSYANAAWDWLDWYGAHMDANGFVTNYVPYGNRWVSTGSMDSTDGYAGTFLTAVGDVFAATGNTARLDALWPAVTKGVAALLATDNGAWLTYAKPNYPHAFIMDNVEVYEGFRAVEYLAGGPHPDAVLRQVAARWTINMPAALEQYWNPARAGYDVAIGFDGSRYLVDWNTLYPAASAQAWMARTGLVPAARAQQIMDHVNTAFPTWDRSGEQNGAFWWPEIIEGMRYGGLSSRAATGIANMTTSVLSRNRGWPWHVGNAGTLLRMIAGKPQTHLAATPGAYQQPGTASFTFAGVPSISTAGAASFECRLDSMPAACGESFTTPVLAEGMHELEVVALDSAGIRDPVPRRFTWTVDSAPPLPRILSMPAEPGNATPVFSFDAIDLVPSEVIDFSCSINGAAFTACKSPATLPVTTTGTHTFRLRATDPAGNTGLETSHTWFADGVRPDTAIVTGPPPTITGGPATFQFSGSDDVGVAGFECRLGSGSWGACASPVVHDLAEGVYVMAVRAVDTAGNIDLFHATRTWRVDRTPPSTVLVEAPSGSIRFTTARMVFSGSDNIAGVLYYECSLNEQPFKRCTSPITYTGLSHGPHSFQVRAVDSSGIADPTPSRADWISDPAPPRGTVTTPDGAILVDLPPAATRSVTGTAADDVTGIARIVVRFAPTTTLGDLVSVDARLTCTDASMRDCLWAAPAPTDSGRYRVSVRAYDGAGNEAALGSTVGVYVV